MKKRQSRTLDTLQRVQRFMDDNDTLLGDLNTSGTRKDLDDFVRVLDQHAVDQATFRRTGSAEVVRIRVLRNALLINHMRPIAAVAASQLSQVPEFVALFMPAHDTTSRRLIAAAGAMATAAAPYSATFVHAGLPSDFIEQMTAAAAALNDSLGRKGEMRTGQVAATSALTTELTRARKIVKALNALIEPKLADNAAILAQWRSTRRYFGENNQATVYATFASAPSLGVLASPRPSLVGSTGTA